MWSTDAVVGRPMWEHRIGISGPQLGRCITAHDAISSHTCGHVAPEALTLLLLIDLQESYRPDGILISESRNKIKSDRLESLDPSVLCALEKGQCYTMHLSKLISNLFFFINFTPDMQTSPSCMEFKN